jgi:hypothetical protein
MDQATTGERDVPMERVLYEVKKVIVGQDHLLERLAVALLARGHILVEGVPGLAKTMAVKTLASAVGGQFKRIQFTPDLVPADLIGTRIYNQKTGEFSTSLGPVFTNPPARRRDRPGAGQGPIGPARGDAGAPGHDRPRHVQGPGAVPRPRHAEPVETGAPTPCPRRRSTGHAQGPRRLPDRAEEYASSSG